MLLQRIKPDGTAHEDNGKLIQDVIYLDGKGNITGFEIIHEEPPTASLGPETRKELELITAKYEASLGQDVAESRVASPEVLSTPPSRNASGAIMDGVGDVRSVSALRVKPFGDRTNLEASSVPTRVDGTELDHDVVAQARAEAERAFKPASVKENKPPGTGAEQKPQKVFDVAHMKERAGRSPYDGSVGVSTEQTVKAKKRGQDKGGRLSPVSGRRASDPSRSNF
jgi:hypothetical protein